MGSSTSSIDFSDLSMNSEERHLFDSLPMIQNVRQLLSIPFMTQAVKNLMENQAIFGGEDTIYHYKS